MLSFVKLSRQVLQLGGILDLVFVIADISYKCFLARMARCSQNLVSWYVSQGVDGGEGSAGAVRRYELIALFGFAGDLSVYLVVYMHFFEEVLADVAE